MGHKTTAADSMLVVGPFYQLNEMNMIGLSILVCCLHFGAKISNY